MNINYESLFMMLKFAAAMLGLLLVIYLLARLTPWAAKKIDKLFSKKPNPERVETKISDEFPDVKGLYDAQLPEIDESKHDNINGDDIENGR